ncbi:MAG: bifunctional precorrin-2 dehydrogenase/sirohydrochlorin ferrochelatase [Dehalococcoidia bacterium]|nr:bifunctional precorrin-2 dehydrogenase/sirohydrochlorin ferrochelatase [Dehalococcoidia bacterium]
MGYYPVFLDLTGRRCLVVGGGTVGARKVEGLLTAGGAVTVISPALSPALRVLEEAGRITTVGREYRRGDAAGYDLCMIATDDGVANAEVARDCRKQRVLVNAADDPPNCDFILPSVLRRGDLQIAVSTGGRSPALSRKVREELEPLFGEEYAELAALSGEVRDALKREGRTFPSSAWLRALTPELRELLRQNRRAEARAQLIEGLRAGVAR